MHTFGHPVRIEEIANLCKEWHIELVEDAAESIGSLYKGQHTGTFGRIGAISFNGNKTITTGGGGMLLFNDEELGKYAKHITTQAKVPHRWEFRHDHIGYNYRMPNINAALGCAQLENLDKYVASKRKVAAEYIEYFKNVDGIDFICRTREHLLQLLAFSSRSQGQRVSARLPSGDERQWRHDSSYLGTYESSPNVRELPERWTEKHNLLCRSCSKYPFKCTS